MTTIDTLLHSGIGFMAANMHDLLPLVAYLSVAVGLALFIAKPFRE